MAMTGAPLAGGGGAHAGEKEETGRWTREGGRDRDIERKERVREGDMETERT